MVNATPRPLYPSGKRPGIHCIGGWVGPKVGLDRCGKSCPHRDSIPGPSSPQRVAIPTALSQRPLKCEQTLFIGKHGRARGSCRTLFIYLLIPCSRVLLERLTGFQLLKKFPAFYGTRRFITATASAHHLYLS